MDHKSCVGDLVVHVYTGEFPQIVVDLKTPIYSCLRLFVGIDLNKSTIHIDLGEIWMSVEIIFPSMHDL